jgi:hypothetical protein
VVVENDRIRAAIDKTVNALQTAVLLAAQIEAEQRDLRRAIDRAGPCPRGSRSNEGSRCIRRLIWRRR